ncbi:MAG TPA: hypothetical protein VGD88_11235 [Opitutaceae bacterium]
MPLQNFHLAAIFTESAGLVLRRFPLRRELQESLAVQWEEQLSEFLDNVRPIAFDPGYNPESDEVFKIDDFQAPDWLAARSSLNAAELDSIVGQEDNFQRLGCVMAFARTARREEIVLFQNFVSSHLIKPGKFFFQANGTYITNEKPGLTLDRKLTAVYFPGTQRLFFKNFRATNTFLPLASYFSEASGEEIRQILSHRIFAPESVASVDALAANPPQWFRKRFAMLRASGVLDGYTAEQIRTKSSGYDVEVRIDRHKIVFPADRTAAKKLLQFLNEEIFRGAITEKLYETNSKRKAGE